MGDKPELDLVSVLSNSTLEMPVSTFNGDVFGLLAELRRRWCLCEDELVAREEVEVADGDCDMEREL